MRFVQIMETNSKFCDWSLYPKQLNLSVSTILHIFLKRFAAKLYNAVDYFENLQVDSY